MILFILHLLRCLFHLAKLEKSPCELIKASFTLINKKHAINAISYYTIVYNIHIF